jgi:gliding motility-associated-like protein
MIARTATKACCLLLLTIISFTLQAQLVANFTATPTSACAPLVVHFKDITTNQPTQWKWNLGNGTISFLQNPSVTYFNPGQYTIKLVVKNRSGEDSITKTKFINVYAQPKVQFKSNITSGCFPLPVQFTDQSTAVGGVINTWQWDFGDGFSSSLQNPAHTYHSSGNFSVTLRVRNSNNCLTTLSKSQFIKISSGVKANFSNNVPDNCTFPVPVNFKNLSAGTGTLTYKWDFGDGTVSTQLTPLHTYSNYGIFTVSLIVTNASGCTDTITKANEIEISKVKAAFTNADTVCTLQPLLFTNTSSQATVSNKWSFGDGTFSSAINPIKKYTNAGTFDVKLIANFGSCTDSAIKTITVSPKPLAAFTLADSVSCNTPFAVRFNSQAAGAVAYKWSFGDSTFSTDENPVHTYTGRGKFTVQLVITNANGCTDSIIKKDVIKIQKPMVSFGNLPDSGCIPFTKTFITTINTVDPVTGYLWNFGDGSSSTEATPTHIYSNEGVYAVSVIVTTAGGCTDTAIVNRGIIADAKPVLNFTASPRITCAKTAVDFKDLTIGKATKWLWLFGDNNASNVQNPSHLYSDTGKFDIKLLVWNNGCADSILFKDYIHINAPIAKFTLTMDCKKPYERVFTDHSIGADEWNWDFGDGTTSTQKNVTHQYPHTGLFETSLMVKNYTTGCEFTTKIIIQIVAVKAAFTTSDSAICKGGQINFTTGLSLSDVGSFNWNFGDGTNLNSLTNTATHVYRTAGNYTVRLIITNILGCTDTLTKNMNIRVNGPTAKFSSTVPGSCLNTPVIFNNLSVTDGQNSIKNFTWIYGDGYTETLATAPFQHAYAGVGTYVVKLLITDSIGCRDSFTIATPLIISKPVAKFITADTLTCPTKPVHFVNQSTGPHLTYRWAFGDGGTSTVQSPFYTFAGNGSFTVSLYITDQYGCTDSVSKPNFINIVTPKVNFLMSDSLSTCPPLIVQFTNLSSNYISTMWDFGDGNSATIEAPTHFYSYPGTYLVNLTAAGPGGCTTTMEKSILIKGPRGTFNYDPVTGCNQVKSNFTANTIDAISILWDFNDGATFDTTDSTTNHLYTYAGTYIPKMILKDDNGCLVPIRGRDTIIVTGVKAGFNFNSTALCNSGTVSFTDSSFSNDIINSYKWTMGDGASTTDTNPVHQYINKGLYYPKLVITTEHGCTDSMISSVPVKVVASPHINFTTTANGCTPLTITAKGMVTVADTSALSWHWDFANNNISRLQNPAAENYNTAGVYTIALLATNSSGCTDTISKTIEAYGIPAVTAGQDTFICKLHGINLQATGASTYNWSPSTGLSCTTCANPLATPASEINYIVKGTSIHGCTGSGTLKVIVKYPFKISYGNRDTLCRGESAKLFATGANNYVWTPAAGLNNPLAANPGATPDTTTNYMVVGKDDKNCFTDTGYVFIKVYPIPVVNAGNDQRINVGKSLDLLPVISADVTQVLWSPTSGIFRSSYPGITIKPITNTEYTVKVINGGGCTAEDKVNIIVTCDGSNIFIPNTFSPNGDGANDIFYPRGSGLFKIKNFRIFNRWGQIVFEKNSFNANDPSAGWDGTFRGAKLNPEVFVYTIDIICDNNTILNYKGNIALIQ